MAQELELESRSRLGAIAGWAVSYSGTTLHCVSVKFGGGNISIATFLFPCYLQLSCTRKILETIYLLCSLFYRGNSG